MSIGRNIMLIAYDKKIKQKDIANAVGISEMMMSKIVNGQKNPSVEKLVLIAAFLDVSVDELVK